MDLYYRDIECAANTKTVTSYKAILIIANLVNRSCRDVFKTEYS